MTPHCHFYLNDREVKTTVPRGLLVLDYLRHHQRMTGTKEGCKEGDCGACGVLIGTLTGGEIRYEAVTACLMPLGELHGKHLVTVEGLNLPALSPVQESIVQEGASQCGFCTPGIVVSLTSAMMAKGSDINQADVKTALSGHLCRCTGYASLLRAGEHMIHAAKSLSGGDAAQRDHIKTMVAQKMLPAYFLNMPTKLAGILPWQQNGKAKTSPVKFIAGGTDLYVQQGESLPDQPLEILNLYPEMRGVRSENGEIRVGALTTFENFAADPLVQQAIPEIKDYMYLIASLQIRNRATLGGNIVNASPIGDMTILLLAMGSRLILKKGDERRSLPMREFYTGYKQLAKSADEIVTEIIFPATDGNTRVNYEKVSKRECLDISSVTSGLRITVDQGIIDAISLSVGGVAAVPLFMSNTCNFLLGKVLKAAVLEEALAIAQQEIAPISDIRGSAHYKRILTRQLIIAHFSKLFPEQFALNELLAGLIE